MNQPIASAERERRNMLTFSLNGINNVDICSWMMCDVAGIAELDS